MHHELIEIVDREGNTIGVVKRAEAHGNPALLHKVVHLLVTNHKGDILLQKRSIHKDVAPGLWDTSVGGHIDVGETIEQALKRESLEELGIDHCELSFLYSYIHSNPYESELVYTYKTTYEGPFRYNTDEIEEIRFWSIEEIQYALQGDLLSDNFKSEFSRYIEHLKANPQED